MREQVAAIGEALGEPVRYEEVSRERARELMKAQGGFAAESADLMLGFDEYSGDAATGDDGYAECASGRTWSRPPDAPRRDYTEWARDHIADSISLAIQGNDARTPAGRGRSRTGR
ncbi:hypothetical protein ACTMTF_46860 [Nonomuraea sp. ZG12]|uniref:hypothetical protein n=1 Tax=Nonomuraea sp. ZG12 TaxID=3452207 RepID=UPI003F8C1475